MNVRLNVYFAGHQSPKAVKAAVAGASSVTKVSVETTKPQPLTREQAVNEIRSQIESGQSVYAADLPVRLGQMLDRHVHVRESNEIGRAAGFVIVPNSDGQLGIRTGQENLGARFAVRPSELVGLIRRDEVIINHTPMPLKRVPYFPLKREASGIKVADNQAPQPLAPLPAPPKPPTAPSRRPAGKGPIKRRQKSSDSLQPSKPSPEEILKADAKPPVGTAAAKVNPIYQSAFDFMKPLTKKMTHHNIPLTPNMVQEVLVHTLAKDNQTPSPQQPSEFHSFVISQNISIASGVCHHLLIFRHWWDEVQFIIPILDNIEKGQSITKKQLLEKIKKAVPQYKPTVYYADVLAKRYHVPLKA